jgi:hypothetical protein
MAAYYCNTRNVAPIEGARFHCNMCADGWLCPME